MTRIPARSNPFSTPPFNITPLIWLIIGFIKAPLATFIFLIFLAIFAYSADRVWLFGANLLILLKEGINYLKKLGIRWLGALVSSIDRLPLLINQVKYQLLHQASKRPKLLLEQIAYQLPEEYCAHLFDLRHQWKQQGYPDWIIKLRTWRFLISVLWASLVIWLQDLITRR
jgi:hypothetical protein